MKEQHHKIVIPKVSILVPVYGVEYFIERCARSLFEQTYQNLEFVFVDDCTPDKSIEILQQVIIDYPERKDSVQIIRHDHNRGISAARNTLIDACTGEFIVFVDSDDWIEPDSVELLVNKQLETNADIITPNRYCEKKDATTEYLSGGYDLDKDNALRAILNTQITHILTGRLIRTSLIKNHHLHFKEGANFDEDFQVLTQAFYYAKTVSGIPDYIYHYSQTNESASIRSFLDWKMLRQSLISYDIVKSFFSDKERCLNEIIEKRTIQKYHWVLFLMAKASNREAFDFCKQYLLHYDKQYLSAIHWDNSFIRVLESNYYILKLIIPIRMIRARIMQALH